MGTALSTINTVSYYMFTTGENVATDTENLPGAAFEVDPNVTADFFSTLNYQPTCHCPRLEPAGRQFRCALVVHRQ